MHLGGFKIYLGRIRIFMKLIGLFSYPFEVTEGGCEDRGAYFRGDLISHIGWISLAYFVRFGS